MLPKLNGVARFEPWGWTVGTGFYLDDIASAFRGYAISLLLAVMANRVLRGAGIYKTLLIWPYAVAPVVAGVLWLFMFASPDRKSVV